MAEVERDAPAYFGLDDSDLEEWLESSSESAVAGTLALPKQPKATKVLTALVYRGAREGPSGDACRQVPPSRRVLTLAA
jgi:hypothetical protein